MATLYIYDNKTHKWNNNNTFSQFKINYGDPISIIYRKIRIVSSGFDLFGSSEVMVVNNIKSTQTKECSQDNIIYYDKDASVKRLDYLRKILDIDVFDPSEYGSEICYYNPSYQNNNISISTKFLELDQINIPSFNKIFSLISQVPVYGIYLSLAGTVLLETGKLLGSINDKKMLSDVHTVQFGVNNPDRPLLEGCYICFPNITDKNVIKSIILDYIIEDNSLIKYVDNKIIEFDDTYFIIEISKAKRDDLLDFDFVASSNNLLQELHKQNNTGIMEFSSISQQSKDFDIIQKIITEYQQNNLQTVKSLYNHLHKDTKIWFDNVFNYITEKM